MRRDLVILTIFGLLGCNRGALVGGGVTQQTARAGAKSPRALPSSDAGKARDAAELGLVLACGLTREASADTMEEEHEPVGCALLDADTRRKTQADVRDLSVTFTLADGHELTPAATPTKSANWHVFLQLPGGELESRKALAATAVIDGQKVVARAQGEAVHDPEGVAARAEPVAPALESVESGDEG